jgi:hypothetical protein
MSPLDRAQLGQAEAWLTQLIQKKLDAGSDQAYADQLADEWEAESLRNFGNTRGPCTPRSVPHSRR